MLPLARLAAAASCRAVASIAPSQRRAVWMDAPARLVRVDLPVDLVVVLEQQERAGQPERTKRALRERWLLLGGEHVFVR